MMHRIVLGFALALSFTACGADTATQQPDDMAGNLETEPSAGKAVAAGGSKTPITVDECVCSGNQTCNAEKECVEAKPCTGPEDCFTGRICTSGACADACSNDGDCIIDGQTCDPTTGVCLVKDTCETDDDCPDGRCVTGECVANCTDQTCTGAQICDEATGECREPLTCMVDEDCLGDRVCRDGSCTTACTEAAQCPGSQECVAGQCIEPVPCTTHVDCTGDRVCNLDGQCMNPCTREPCAINQTCGDDGICRTNDVDQCTTDLNCLAGQTCTDGRCIGMMGCNENADCPGAERCVDGSCTAPCVGDADCPDQRCDAISGSCIPDNRCRDNADCMEGRCIDGDCIPGCMDDECPGQQICNAMTGECDEPAQCVADIDCLDDRICLDGTCNSPCRDGADCQGAQRCVEGACTEPDLCNSSLDCVRDRVCGQDQRCADPCDRANCGGQLVCDAPSGMCREMSPCEGDDGCFVGRLCSPTGECIDECTMDADCGAGRLTCNQNTGLCVEPNTCNNDIDCLGDRLCNQGACSDRCMAGQCQGRQSCNPASGLCDEPNFCELDRDCLNGRICSFGRCRDRCQAAADCEGAQACVNERCSEPIACQRKLDCLGDRVCSALARCTDPCGRTGCPGLQVCLGATGLCQEPAECGVDLDCFGERRCVSGECIDPCSVDNPCPGNDVCDNGVCVQGPCQNDGDCGRGRCLNQECQTPCEQGTCPGAQVCDAGPGICREPAICANNTDCLDNRLCQFGSCRDRCDNDRVFCDGAQSCDVQTGECNEPDPCNGDMDCLGARVCGGDRTCAAPCDEVPCPGGLRCINSRCEEALRCVDASGCFDGRNCVDNTCVDPCREAADCPGVRLCEVQTGLCVLPTDCNFDGQCGDGRICVNNTCTDRCPDVPCVFGEQCNPVSGRCLVEGACGEPADCRGAQQCIDERCVEPQVCNGNIDCLGERVCRQNRCQSTCVTADDCPGNQICSEGLCAESGSCQADVDCISNRACHPKAGVCTERCPTGICDGALVCDDAALCSEPSPCLDDTNCIDTRVCRLGRCVTGQCERSSECNGFCVNYECAATIPNSACPLGWLDVDGQCIQPGPCDANTCPAPWACQPDGTCGRCVADIQCPGSFLCEDGQCTDDGHCDAVGCLPGRICREGLCEPDFLNCDDDGLSNHAPNVAEPLDSVVFTGLMACEARSDWYRFASEQNNIAITIRYAKETNPLQLRLFDVDDANTPVDVSVLKPGIARVSAGPGEYLVEVVAGPGAGGLYSIEVTSNVDCVQDAWDEPWRNDTIGHERLIHVGTIDGTLCANDTDRYRVNLDRLVNVSIVGANAMIQQDGAQPVPAPASVDGPVNVVVTGAPLAKYELTVTTPPAPAQACQNADVLVLNTPTDATISTGGDDFNPVCIGAGGSERVFTIDIQQQGRLNVDLDTAESEAYLMLYSNCEAEPLSCSTVGDRAISELVDVGRYYVVVDGDYSGTITATFVPPSVLCDNPAELQTGGIAIPAGPSDLVECTDPELGAVVRYFELAEARQVDIELTQAIEHENLTLTVREICEDGGTQRACDIAPAPSVSKVLPAGRYTVILQGEPGAANVEFRVSEPPQSPVFSNQCPGQEPGPVLMPGTRLEISGTTQGAGDNADLSTCGAGAQGVDVSAPFRLGAESEINIMMVDGLFLPTISIMNANCDSVTCSENALGALGGDFTATLPAGDYHLVVESDPQSTGEFTIQVDIQND